MFRSARGELDARIAATRAAIDRRTQCRRLRRWLAEEETRLRRLRRELDRRIVANSPQPQPAQATALAAVVTWIRGAAGPGASSTLALDDAELAMREVAAELAELATQRRRIEAELGSLRGAEVHLAELMKRCEAWQAKLGEARAADLTALANELGAWAAVRRELAEALRLAADARDELEAALAAADAEGERDGEAWSEIALRIAAGNRQLALFARELGDAAERAAELGVEPPDALTADADRSSDRYGDPRDLLRAELARLEAMRALVERLDRDAGTRIDALERRRTALLEPR